jgi:hypothetical protein
VNTTDCTKYDRVSDRIINQRGKGACHEIEKVHSWF